MPLINDPSSQESLPIVPLWINGQTLPLPTSSNSPSSSLFPVISASKDATPIHNAHSASPSEATLAVEAASAAFSSWSQTSPSHRRNLLLKAADIVESRKAEIMKAQTDETSCPEMFAAVNVKEGVEKIREIAAATSEIRGKMTQRGTTPGGLELGGLTVVVKEAVGVVLVIPPWNGAVILPLRAMSMALAAGCSIVLKASELCPLTHSLLVQSFEDAGIPVGVINQIQARREDAASVVEAVISHKALRKVDFIGSAAVGKQIGMVCAKYLKPILMELGGKGPAVVLDDADLGKAVGMCAMGAIVDHGQLCFSTERIIVHKAIYQPFIQALTGAMQKMGHLAGNAVSIQSAQHAISVLKDAEEKGAEFLLGGPEYLPNSKIALKPTLITKITPEMRIHDEETFGPSACIYMVEDDDEVIKVANDSSYGLSAAVWSKSWERGWNISRRLEYGQVQVNGMTVADSAAQPISAVKGSGWGQSGGIWGINEFLVEKTIAMHPSDGPSFGAP